jgi:hypothetical protein
VCRIVIFSLPRRVARGRPMFVRLILGTLSIIAPQPVLAAHLVTVLGIYACYTRDCVLAEVIGRFLRTATGIFPVCYDSMIEAEADQSSAMLE